MNLKRQKKSQMEIMGLAVVVVLLVLGMLFAVKFVLFKPSESYRKEYINTQLAANMLNTVLNIHSECNNILISELLQDAGKQNPNIIDCPGGLNSEEYVKKTIINLTNETLKKRWNRDYYFKASVPSKTIVEAGEMHTDRERERKRMFIQSDVGVMTIILDIY